MPLETLENGKSFLEQRTKINAAVDEINSITDGTISGDIPVTATGTTTARTLGERASDVVNVKDFGIDLTGTEDASPNLAYAASKNFDKFIFVRGRYLLNTDVTFSIDTQLIIEKGVWFLGSGRIKGNVPSSYGTISTVVSGSEPFTENGGVNIDSYDGDKAYIGKYFSLIRGGTPTSNTETDVIRVDAKTKQESSYDGFNGDLVGIHAKIAPWEGNKNARLFGVNPYIDIPPNTDGLANGCEVNIINYGSEVKVMNARDAKYAFNATCEIKGHTGTGYPATGAYKISTGGVNEKFWTGLWAGLTSLVPDPAAQFIELDKRFGVNSFGNMGIGIEYSHSDFNCTINGDSLYTHSEALSNPDQYGEVVDTSLGQRDAKILLNSGEDKSAQVTYAGKLTGSIFSQGRDDTDGSFKVVSGTNIITGDELSTLDSSGNHRFKGRLDLGGTSEAGGAGAMIVMTNADTPPSSTVAGQGVLYIEDGQLKFRGGSGTVTVLAPA